MSPRGLRTALRVPGGLVWWVLLGLALNRSGLGAGGSATTGCDWGRGL